MNELIRIRDLRIRRWSQGPFNVDDPVTFDDWLTVGVNEGWLLLQEKKDWGIVMGGQEPPLPRQGTRYVTKWGRGTPTATEGEGV